MQKRKYYSAVCKYNFNNLNIFNSTLFNYAYVSYGICFYSNHVLCSFMNVDLTYALGRSPDDAKMIRFSDIVVTSS